MVLLPMPSVFSIVKLSADAVVPEWALKSSFFSITRTTAELSIVVDAQDLPEEKELREMPTFIGLDSGWAGFAVKGPLDFSLTGILASIANPLKERQVSLFAISTFDTDIILVKKSSFKEAQEGLRQAGFQWAQSAGVTDEV